MNSMNVNVRILELSEQKLTGTTFDSNSIQEYNNIYNYLICIMTFKKGYAPWNKGKTGVQVAWNKDKEHLKNEKHPMWKGNKAGYSAIHDWIRRNKVKPILCEVCNQKKKLQASNISGEYKRDINDFIYVCSKCHSKIDHKSRPKGQDVKTSKLKNKQIAEIFKLREEGLTYKAIGEKYGVTKHCIFKIITKVNWKNYENY